MGVYHLTIYKYIGDCQCSTEIDFHLLSVNVHIHIKRNILDVISISTPTLCIHECKAMQEEKE